MTTGCLVEVSEATEAGWARQSGDVHRRPGHRRHRRVAGCLREGPMEVLTAGLAVVVLYLFGSLRIIRQYERAVMFFLGRFWGTKGPGLIFVPASLRRRSASRCASSRWTSPPGRHHPRQRLGQGERGALLSRDGPGARHHGDRGLPLRHRSARADHAPLGAGPGGARRAAGRPREDQRGSSGDHRRAHRPLGRRGLRGRGEGRGSAQGVCGGRWRAKPKRSGSGGPR